MKPDTSPPGSENVTPDIERVVVNGDTYAVVNNNRKTIQKPKPKVEEINYIKDAKLLFCGR